MKKYSFLFYILLIILSCSNKTQIYYEESNQLLKQYPLEKDPTIVNKRWDLKLSEKYFSKQQTLYKSAVFITFCKVKINNKIYWIPDNANFSSSNKTKYADVCNYKIEIFLNKKNQVCYRINFSQLLYYNYTLKTKIDSLYNNFDDFNKCYISVYNLLNKSKNIELCNDYNPYKSGEFVTFSRTYLFTNTNEGLIVEEEQILNPTTKDLKKISNANQWIINNDESMMLQNLSKGSPDKFVEPIIKGQLEQLEKLIY